MTRTRPLLLLLLSVALCLDVTAWTWAILCSDDQRWEACLMVAAIHSAIPIVLWELLAPRRVTQPPVLPKTVLADDSGVPNNAGAPSDTATDAVSNSGPPRPRAVVTLAPPLHRIEDVMQWTDAYIRDPANVLEVAQGAHVAARAHRANHAKALAGVVIQPSDPSLRFEVDKQLALMALYLARDKNQHDLHQEVRRLCAVQPAVLEALGADPTMTPRSILKAILFEAHMRKSLPTAPAQTALPVSASASEAK